MTYLFLTMSEFSHYSPYKRAIGTGEGLAKLGHIVYVVAKDCQENRDRMRIEAPHCKVVLYSGGILNEIFTKIISVWRIRPDVFYDPSVYSVRNLAFLRWLLPRRTKKIVEFSELFSVCATNKTKWRTLETIACVENQYILCASKFLFSVISKKCQKMGLRRKFLYSPYAYPSYLHPQKISNDNVWHIVYLGSISKGYGFQCLLDAFAIIHRKNSNGVVLEVLGSGCDITEMKEWVRQQHLEAFVMFRGYVAEEALNEHLSRADVFVLPLHNTDQDRARCPSKVFYYLPYAKPIVTCAVGNPYDILGDYGFYYEPMNAVSMAQTILKALNDSAKFSYPQRLLEENSWDARARQLEEWLTEEN